MNVLSARRSGQLALVLALALALTGCPPKPVPDRPGPGPGPAAGGPPPGSIVISAFYVAPQLKGGPEEAIRIANVSGDPIDLADCSLSDVLGPSAGSTYVQRGKGLRRDVAFPVGTEATILMPGGEITVARDAWAYHDQFGELPDFEVGEDSLFPENDEAVPDMTSIASSRSRRSAKSIWPTWPAAGADVIVLFGPPDAFGDTPVLDVVVWDFKPKGKDPLLQDELREYERLAGLPSGALWDGPPLDPWGELASPYGTTSRVFARDRDAAGRIQPDTNSYHDWDSGSSLQHLGDDPVHRIEMAGQSHFLSAVYTERALITATSAPDNNFSSLRRAWEKAEKEIRVSVYYFKNFELMDTLLAAIERGVDVTLWMEGTTVGVKHGFTDGERYIAQRIEAAGREHSKVPTHGFGRVYWLRTDGEQYIGDRYFFDHSKYSIIDGRILIVGSENYGPTGHPVDPSNGNRGWEIQIATPPGEPPLRIVQYAMAVWDDDVDPQNHKDVVRYSDHPAQLDEEGRGRYGPPPKSYDPESDRKPKPPGGYVPLYPEPVTIDETATFELVVSPDTSLSETTSILAAIQEAREELLVQHLDLRLYWGSRVRSIARTPKTTPDLVLEAIVAAARRGVRVRVLLDCSLFNCDRGPEESDPKRDSNDDTVAWLRELAAAEGLDLQARLIDVDNTADRRGEDREDAGYSKIHNKGLVIDGRKTLISSINGSENSFKGNREMGVIVTSEAVAHYYRSLFLYDWTTIAAPTGVLGVPGEAPAVASRAAVDVAAVDVAALDVAPTAAVGLAADADGDRLEACVDGLAPDTEYFFRVTAFDDDAGDVDALDRSLRFGPHESGFSDEVSVRSSKRGRVCLSWDANESEKLEGDLAGYRIWFGLASGATLSLPDDAKKLARYDGVSTRMGASPLTLDRGGRPGAGARTKQ